MFAFGRACSRRRGLYCGQAEDTTIDESLAVVQDYSAASSKKGVYMVREAKDQTGAALPGAIGFSLTATYAVWARYSAATDGCDSYYSSIGGAVLTGGENEFGWLLLDNTTITEGQSMTYRIRPRESKSVFDKFVITNVRGYVPEGIVDTYPAPAILPPTEHPRLLFRASDIPQIKANMESKQGKNAMIPFQNQLKQTTDGVLEMPKDAKTSNYNGNLLGVIESHAFNYAINGDEASGKMAVEAIQNIVNTSVFANTSDITWGNGTYDFCGL